MLEILLIIAIFLLSYIWVIWRRQSPPISVGPTPLPFIGNIHQMGKNPPLQFSKWANKYGKLYTVYFGWKPAIVINDITLMKQIFNRSECNGRPRSLCFEDMFPSGGGILYGTGKVWQDHRPFFVRGLKSFERNCNHEPIITLEISELCKWMENEMVANGQVYLYEQLKAFTSTVNWSLVCGSRQEPQIAALMENWVQTLQKVTESGAMFFDIIGQIAPGWSGKAIFNQRCDEVRALVVNQFEIEKANNGESGNLICSYLKLIEGTTDPESTFYGKKGFEEAVDSVLSIAIAGTETTATLLNWLIFNMCTHPHIQTKVQQEVDDIGGEIGLRHRTQMPYTEAFIEETLRMASVGAFGLFHEVEEDFDLNGVTIPKGIQLVPNIYHVNNDKDVWGDPEVLKPERFLESDGGKALKELNMSFQPGKRVCPGESFARDELFLSITNLTKCFTFIKHEEIPHQLYVEADRAFLSIPKPVPVKIKARK